MEILEELSSAIDKIGVKEIARRSGLSPSTVSRVGSGQISPSFEVVQRIAKAAGFGIKMQVEAISVTKAKLTIAKDVLGRLRKELRQLGVRHAIVFGSVARGEDKESSDIDIYLDFPEKPKVARMLKAEGRVIDSFGQIKVDIVSWNRSEKGLRLMEQIEKDGIRVF